MPDVNKEHLQLAAVIAAGFIQTGSQDSRTSQATLTQALVNSYKAVQDAVHQIQQGK